MATNQGARDDEPAVEVINVIEERGSHTRVRSARNHAVDAFDVDENERPTVVPGEPVALDAEALEARVLYESRAVMERRYAAATQQDLQATRRMDAVDLDLPIHISVDHSAIDEAFERRRARVRTAALTVMLAIVLAIATIAILR